MGLLDKFRRRKAAQFVEDQFTGEVRQIQDNMGREIPDPKPLELPAGFKRPETLQEQIRRLVHSEHFMMEREAAGEETFDEADDFDVDDDFDPSTPFETFFDPVLQRDVSPEEFAKNAEGYKKRYENAMKLHFQQLDEDEIIQDNLLRKRWQEKQKAEKGGGEGEPSPSQAKPVAS